jgi:Tetratricopeptide repeat
MTPNEILDLGNEYRAQRNPEKALECYAQAFVMDRNYAPAFNNYGNVLRELGDPAGSIPFLERAITLEPNYVHAHFNRAVSLLLAGDYERGWPAYECRWHYEHLAGTEPNFDKPKWRGEDLKDKTILVVGEQGHGDIIQFSRFIFNLKQAGATVLLQTTSGLVRLFSSGAVSRVGVYGEDLGEFDYWIPIMSLPGILGVTVKNFPKVLSYLSAPVNLVADWQKILGPKKKIRVGFGWTGRRDSWLNLHKSIPLPKMLEIIKANPEHDWINLQADATPEEASMLADAGVLCFPGTSSDFADTAALMMHLDVVVSVDTSNAHLAGALGRPTWIMLNKYAVDWRWMVDKRTTHWYQSAVLFRQDAMDDWDSVNRKITQHLKLYKI